MTLISNRRRLVGQQAFADLSGFELMVQSKIVLTVPLWLLYRMKKVCLIKTAVASMEQAEALASALVQRHLVACAQISSPGRSIYHWQGKLEVEEEYYLTLKTTPSRCETAVAYLRASHPYELPEIIWSSFDATDGYSDWVYGEVDARIAIDEQE